ncbi:MAG TPA: hypothetical protein VIM74_04190, partial [Casimicrobiaceae bacterium]
ISQEVRAFMAKREMRRITDAQTAALNTAGQERSDVIQSTTLDTASKLAIHTSDKTSAIGDELAEIHQLVNGNTTALQARITELETQRAALEAQLRSGNQHT